MAKKRAPEIQEEILKKNIRGQAVVNAGEKLETYRSVSFTPAGDRITPYEADEDLGEKGNIKE